jgi:hypothetical protein
MTGLTKILNVKYYTVSLIGIHQVGWSLQLSYSKNCQKLPKVAKIMAGVFSTACLFWWGVNSFVNQARPAKN